MQFLYGRRALTNNTGVAFENPIPFTDALDSIQPGRDLIDHVLVGAGVDVADADRLEDVNALASDHFPVLAVLSF